MKNNTLYPVETVWFLLMKYLSQCASKLGYKTVNAKRFFSAFVMLKLFDFFT